MKKYIVDAFTFFAPTCKELLELRINMLNDYVDKFVICESNKTHSGVPIPYELRDVIQDLNLPRDKIEIIDLDIPDDDLLEIKDIDYANCYHGNSNNINSVRARARERLQQDSLNLILDKFPDDSFFIISCLDEIINPIYIDWFADMVLQNPSRVVKVPLVHLEGRADLRVHMKDTGHPKSWDGAMVFCTKHHLKLATVCQMRSNFQNPFPVSYICQNGARVEDVGWHFSWMGNSAVKDIKRKSFCHYNDKFDFIVGGSYGSNEAVDVVNSEPKEGDISPSGEINTILKKYPIENLPRNIFFLPRVKEFLLPETSDIFEKEYLDSCKNHKDISPHLPVLNWLARTVGNVTEIGTNDGESTRAFLYSDATLKTYDNTFSEKNSKIIETAKNFNKNAEYILGDLKKIDIDDTDLLFIDAEYNFDQLKSILSYNSSKVKKYIVIHNTKYNEIDKKEPLELIIEFLVINKNWKFKLYQPVKKGLIVLEKDE